MIQDWVRNKELLSVPNNLRPNPAALDRVKLSGQTKGKNIMGLPWRFPECHLVWQKQQGFSKWSRQQFSPKTPEPVNPLKTGGHLPQRPHHLQYTAIPNCVLWLICCYQSCFLSLLWKSGRNSSWWNNLKSCSKARSFSLLYFHSCFIIFRGLHSLSSVHCKL